MIQSRVTSRIFVTISRDACPELPCPRCTCILWSKRNDDPPWLLRWPRFQLNRALSRRSCPGLQLLPLFNCFGRYSCKVPSPIPMRGGFYTSKLSLDCSPMPSDTNIMLGSDWISPHSTMMGPHCKSCPSPPFLSSSHHWSPSENPHKGMTTAHRAHS